MDSKLKVDGNSSKWENVRDMEGEWLSGVIYLCEEKKRYVYFVDPKTRLILGIRKRKVACIGFELKVYDSNWVQA
jgi:hypothetical protein